MVRVLTYKHDLDLIERTEVEGIEYKPTRRIDGMMGILLLDKGYEILKVWFVKLLLKVRLPRWFYGNCCHGL